MEGSRKRYDWLFIIHDCGLVKEFDKYIKKHKDISINRAARAFVKHKKVPLFSCYEKDKVEARENYFMRISKVNWIED